MYCVLHLEKRKITDLYGIQIENNREKKYMDSENRNKNIVKNVHNPAFKLGENVVSRSNNWRQSFNDIIKKYGVKKVRKDAVASFDCVYSASPDFFQNASKETQKKFFLDCLKFHLKTFCNEKKDKIISAIIHFDEKTPHLHVVSVPVYETENGAVLSAFKYINGKKDCVKLQTNFYNDVGEKYGLERGRENTSEIGVKHLDTVQFKVKQEEKKHEALKKSNEIALNELNKNRDLMYSSKDDTPQEFDKKLDDKKNDIINQNLDILNEKTRLSLEKTRLQFDMDNLAEKRKKVNEKEKKINEIIDRNVYFKTQDLENEKNKYKEKYNKVFNDLNTLKNDYNTLENKHKKEIENIRQEYDEKIENKDKKIQNLTLINDNLTKENDNLKTENKDLKSGLCDMYNITFPILKFARDNDLKKYQDKTTFDTQEDYNGMKKITFNTPSLDNPFTTKLDEIITKFNGIVVKFVDILKIKIRTVKNAFSRWFSGLKQDKENEIKRQNDEKEKEKDDDFHRSR